jgi:hypothetical protein
MKPNVGKLSIQNADDKKEMLMKSLSQSSLSFFVFYNDFNCHLASLQINRFAKIETRTYYNYAQYT